jgi:hypothetical protein
LQTKTYNNPNLRRLMATKSLQNPRLQSPCFKNPRLWLTYKQKIHLWSSPYLRIIQYILNSAQQKKKNEKLKLNKIKFSCSFNKILYLLTFNIVSHNYCYWKMYFWQLMLYPLVVNIWLFVAFHCQRMCLVIVFGCHHLASVVCCNPHHLVLWSFLGLSQWVYVHDDMSKGLKIMSLGVINHSMSLSVLYESTKVGWLSIWIILISVLFWDIDLLCNNSQMSSLSFM